MEIKLTDFGIACVYDPADPPTKKCGTLTTVAPEILTQESYDHKVDCWSLGVILFEFLSGDFPFTYPDENQQDTKSFQKQICCKQMELDEDPNWVTVSDEAKDLLRLLM